MFRLGLSLLFLISAACQNNSSPRNNSNTPVVFNGDLTKKIHEIYDEKNWALYFSSCDERKEEIFKIAAELESKRSEIESFARQQTTEDLGISSHQIDRFTFYTENKPAPGADHWQTFEKGWGKLIDVYTQIAQKPVDLKWVMLNSRVRGLVTDDERRLLDHMNIGLSRNREAVVVQTHQSVEACWENPSCLMPELSPAEEGFLRDGPEYYYYRILINNEASDKDKRKALETLRKWTLRNRNRYVFSINKDIHFENSKINLPMDGSVFGLDGAKVKSYVETIWNTDAKISLNIDFISNAKNIFKIFVDDVLGQRAYVSYGQKKMQLYNYDALFVVAHELGHVLGFKDYYYTTFDPKKCTYEVEHNDGDIMSSGNEGVKALTSHWRQLKQHYVR